MIFSKYLKRNNMPYLPNECDCKRGESITPREFFYKTNHGNHWIFNGEHSFKCGKNKRLKENKYPQHKVSIVLSILALSFLISVFALGVNNIYGIVKGDGELYLAAIQTASISSAHGIPKAASVNLAAQGAKSKKTSATISLYEGHSLDNSPMNYQNMFPGDTVTNEYCVKVYHDNDVNVFFKATVKEKTKNVDEALRIRVTHLDTGKILCDDFFKNVNGKGFSELFKSNSNNETEAYYRIDVYLDTSVGNEYQLSLLKADFEWYVDDTEEDILTPYPKTGDTMHLLMLSAITAVSGAIIILYVFKRKEERQGA